MKNEHLKQLHEMGKALQSMAKTHGYKEGSQAEENAETPDEEGLEPPDAQDDNADKDALLNAQEPNHPLSGAGKSSPGNKKINAGIIIALRKKMGK